MSFKDALNKSAEAQKKLAADTKKKDKTTPSLTSTNNIEISNIPTTESVDELSNSNKIEKVGSKQFEGVLTEYLKEEELRDMSNRKTYQTYPTIHKMVKLACNKTGKDLITYVNEAILEQLKKDDIIGIFEIIHGKLK